LFVFKKGIRGRTLFVEKPIAVLVETNLFGKEELLFVGSNGGPGSNSSSVLVIDTKNWVVLTKLQHAQLQHPSGLVLFENKQILLVFSQITGQIVAFNLASLAGSVWSEKVIERPEAMIVVEC
jgi:hypothetical protein